MDSALLGLTSTTDMTKACLNPHCKTKFTPGRYGDRQMVCRGSFADDCPSCKGEGTTVNGNPCQRCKEKGEVKRTCKDWYKGYWSQTRKTPRGIPDNEIAQILKAAHHDPTWYALIVTAIESGMRKGELLGLTWGDILDGREVRVDIEIRGQWSDQKGGFHPTKTGSVRVAYLLDGSRAALGRLWGSFKKPIPKLTDRIWSVSEGAAWARFVALQRSIGVKSPDTGRPYRFHDMRHTAAIRTYKATGDIHRATMLLGHRNPATTMVYTQERPEDFVKGLNSALPGLDMGKKPKRKKKRAERIRQHEQKPQPGAAVGVSGNELQVHLRHLPDKTVPNEETEIPPQQDELKQRAADSRVPPSGRCEHDRATGRRPIPRRSWQLRDGTGQGRSDGVHEKEREHVDDRRPAQRQR